MKIFKYFFVFFMLGWAGFASAEVPFHNPDLDYKCGPGFQWSRDTASCKQADCPAGAGRTYTLDCSCGEAWNKPFTTCYDKNTPGLATSCVPAGSQCPSEKSKGDKGKDNSGKPEGENRGCTVVGRIFSFLPSKGFISDLKKSVNANECVKAPSGETASDDNESYISKIYDARQEIIDTYKNNGLMTKRIIEVTLSDGRTVKVGLVSGPYLARDEDRSLIPDVMYTVDGYNFYSTPDRALNPSWWQRLWTSSRPEEDKFISKLSRSTYNDLHGLRDFTDGNTLIERGKVEKLFREYIQLRRDGKTPAQILNPDSDFMALVDISTSNKKVDLVKYGYVFESVYNRVDTFSSFGK